MLCLVSTLLFSFLSRISYYLYQKVLIDGKRLSAGLILIIESTKFVSTNVPFPTINLHPFGSI